MRRLRAPVAVALALGAVLSAGCGRSPEAEEAPRPQERAQDDIVLTPDSVDPADARAAAELTDGVVVGSSALEAAEGGPGDLREYVRSLRAALDAV